MSARLSTIEADQLASSEAPAHWTPDWVRNRMVEAFRIERRLPRQRRATLSAWPTPIHEFADMVYWNDARERVLQSWENAGGVFAFEVQRLEQAHEWSRVYLATYPLERACLLQWAAAHAYGRSLRLILRRRGWSRTTFYRHVGAGSFIIAQRLNVEAVKVS